MCVRVFQFQVAYRMKYAFPMWFVRVLVYGMCVYDCVRVCVCVCVCAWQMVAYICLIALAAKGLNQCN